MLNTFTIQGRLASPPEERYTEKGDVYITFILATMRDRKYKGGSNVFDFPLFTAYGGVARRILKYVAVGQTITVTGRLKTWRSKTQERVLTQLEVKTVYFDRQHDPADEPIPEMLGVAANYDGFDDDAIFPPEGFDGEGDAE